MANGNREGDQLLGPSMAGVVFTPPLTGDRLRQLASDGRIPHLRTVEGRVLFWRSDVEAYRDRRDAERTAKRR
jgi:hypothetical protein